MLEIKKIKKSYKTGDFIQVALNGVSIKFREKEFVSILGTSGSGKTTLLNIIGGLDSFDSGDLLINGESTKNYKEKNWDYYRNNSIGFIFQSYNLITHISILANVELGMTLSGIGSKERKERALDVLDKVGLKDHCHKKPNQLSGGQMQRVAIARAIVNDPDIILADEPTGALDTKTSKEILNLIKEISKDKLVIMVTHNAVVAEEYSNRIVKLKDGEIISDNNPLTNSDIKKDYKAKKTSMNFFTAFGLSLTNIFTKKGRTLLTAFAASIGIIGISIILALSNGFDLQIKDFEKDSLSSFPISIDKVTYEDMDFEKMQEIDDADKSIEFNEKKIYEFDYEETRLIHNNNINRDYLDYISNIDKDLVVGVSFVRSASMNFISNTDNKYQYVDNSLGIFSSLPKEYSNENDYLNENFDLLSGKFSQNEDELLIEVDSNNRVDENILNYFGVESEDDLTDLIGKEIKIVFNDEYYTQKNNMFIPNLNFEDVYNNSNSLALKVVGVIKAKETDQEAPMMVMQSLVGAIYYKDDLSEYLVEKNKDSEIVKAQDALDSNVFSGVLFKDGEKEMFLSMLGANNNPDSISIYPKDFDSKETIIEYLDDYNIDKVSDNQIVYTDMAKTMIALTGNIMDGITTVLVAFSSISLIVSGIMIGIITYISVLERTKEIGILRALGARKKDISRVFNAETFIIGLTSGIMGVGIARLLIFPINIILENMTDLENIAQMDLKYVVLMVALSVGITLLGGIIPARIASKKDPVEALRSE